MPTALRTGPYRFFFYSGDRLEPQHVDVERDESAAKFWLNPVRFQGSSGFAAPELGRVQTVIEEHLEELLRSWDEFFAD